MGLFTILEGLEIDNDNGQIVKILNGSGDPNGSVVAEAGSLFLQSDGSTWHNTDGVTTWAKLIDSSGASQEDGYQNIYTGKPGAGSFLPQYGTPTQVANNDDLTTAITKLDTKIGANLTPVSRTNHPTLAANTIHANLSALDSAIGADSDITGNGGAGWYVTVNSTVMKKIDALDIGLDTHVKDTTNPHDTTLDQVVTENGTTDGAITISSGGSVTVNSGATISWADLPTSNTHLANKQYVDSVAQGLIVKGACKAKQTAADGNRTLSGTTGTLDGISLADGDRVLLTEQTDPIENGIWVVRAGAWERPADFDTGDSASSAFTFIDQGTLYAESGWVCTTDKPNDIIDTNGLTWEQFSGAGQITAGAGLTKDGNTLNVGDANKGVQVNSDNLEIDASEAAGNGITQNGTNSWQFDVEAGDDGSANLADVISVQPEGVSVKVDEIMIGENGSGQLEVPHVTRLSATAVAAGTTNVDTLAMATYAGVEYHVLVSAVTDADDRYSLKLTALNDGVDNVDVSRYAVNKVESSISGLDIDVIISGTDMILQITATEAINYHVFRIGMPVPA